MSEAPGGEESDDPLGALDLPRSGTYAGLEWTVEEVSAAAPEGDGSPPRVRVRFTVHNGLEGVRVTMPDSSLALADDDTILARASGFEGTESSGRVRVESGETVSADALFEVELPDSIDGLAFLIDERDHVPLRLPLVGDASVPDPPTASVVDPRPSESLLFPGTFEEYATFVPVDVRFALDWQAQRAALDTHFALVSFQVTAAPGNEGVSLTIRDRDVRLVVDGEPRKPVDLSGDRQPKPGTTVDLVAVFEVPDDHQALEFAAGADGATDVTWTIQPTT